MANYELSFEGLKEKKGTIAVPLLINKLKNLQDINYLVGEYLAGTPFMKGNFGSRPNSLKNKCTLVVKDIKAGSTVIEISPTDNQSTFDQYGSTCLQGYAALDTVFDLIDKILSESTEGEIRGIIEKAEYLNRVAKLLLDLCPKESDDYSLSLKNRSGMKHVFRHSTKPFIEKIIDYNHKQSVETILGPITDVKVDNKTGKRFFHIWHDGHTVKAEFLPELSDTLLEAWGTIVEVNGELKRNSDGRIIEIQHINNITTKDAIDIKSIKTETDYLELVNPVTVYIEEGLRESKHWSLFNDELGIFSVGKSWDDALQSFEDDFLFIVEEYANSDDEMTIDALELKRKVLWHLNGGEM